MKTSVAIYSLPVPLCIAEPLSIYFSDVVHFIASTKFYRVSSVICPSMFGCAPALLALDNGPMMVLLGLLYK